MPPVYMQSAIFNLKIELFQQVVRCNVSTHSNQLFNHLHSQPFSHRCRPALQASMRRFLNTQNAAQRKETALASAR